MQYVLVAAGGALGSMARLWLGLAMARVAGVFFPWGTLLINVLGSTVIGFVAASGMPGGRFGIPNEARVFLMVGVCGGFTTFSSFSLQTLELLERGDWALGTAYIAGSVVLCVAGCWAGLFLGRT